MSHTEDVQETPPPPEPITVRELWRDVRDLNKEVRKQNEGVARLLLILLGDGDTKAGLVPEFHSLKSRHEFIEKIVLGTIALILIAVLTAGLAYVVRNPGAAAVLIY